jgi:small-conductance mechanosensitive channel
VLVAAGVAFALPIWGFSWSDVSGWMQSSAIGLYVERLTFSLGDIFFAIFIFIAILLATRWLQRALEEHVLPQTRLDVGVRHSLKAAVGYVGLIIALVSAVSSLGLDLSSLALVAGALSVGIGFGLQAIVNNFVSGLILLIERPVKVGDWVVVGGHEGFVKRISVRATEIETLQRASVIVPNSEILSAAVVNLTHKDSAGRIDIAVSVAYGSDIEKVREVLLKCGASHPEVARWPKPQVIFKHFGDSALDFELRVHLDNIVHYWTVSSEIRFAIDKAFREAGIQMPFPQTEIHLSDIERLERALGAGGMRAAPDEPGTGAAGGASDDMAAKARG